MASIDLKFSVLAQTRPGEVLCITGNQPILGVWDPQRCRILRREKILEDRLELWSTTLRLAPKDALEYRYFIAHVHESEGDGEDQSIMVRYWETNLKPRTFSCQQFLIEPEKHSAEKSLFGQYGDKKTIDKGWLISQTEINLRLHGNPIHMWKSAHRQQTYRIRCTTLDLRKRELSMGLDDEESNHELEVGGAETHPYVSVLGGHHEDCELQPQFGKLYKKDDYMIFKIQTHDPENLAYQFDLYVVSTGREEDEEGSPPPKHVGWAYVLPVDMTHSVGRKTWPIIGLKHKPIGQLAVEWLIIKPLVGHHCDMRRSFSKYWKARQPLDVGHRGLGSSYNKPKECEAVRENTIRSLSEAGRYGADFVEFDVQLSRDRIPVVYHDFTVNLTLRKKSEDLDWLEIPVRELNLAQLQMLKLDHVSSKTQGSPLNVSSGSSDIDPIELQPFPTLQDVFEHVDKNLGFAIELKYPVQMKSGSFEEGVANYFDQNLYCDAICRATLKYAATRRILFLSFNPDICTIMRLKQNLYPVIMLTQGKTERYEWYSDERTWSTMRAYSVARSERFLGVCVHSEEVLKDHSLISAGKEKGLVLFGWGEEFANHENVKLCKQLGMDGIIYDKVQEFIAGTGKENVFKIERQTKDEFYKRFGSTNAALSIMGGIKEENSQAQTAESIAGTSGSVGNSVAETSGSIAGTSSSVENSPTDAPNHSAPTSIVIIQNTDAATSAVNGSNTATNTNAETAPAFAIINHISVTDNNIPSVSKQSADSPAIITTTNGSGAEKTGNGSELTTLAPPGGRKRASRGVSPSDGEVSATKTARLAALATEKDLNKVSAQLVNGSVAASDVIISHIATGAGPNGTPVSVVAYEPESAVDLNGTKPRGS